MKTAGALALLSILGASAVAEAHSFVTLRDDGTLAGKVKSPDAITKKIVPLYDATGAERPDVISLWTNFKMDGNAIETLFDPIGNDVRGIGLEGAYGGDGTMKSSAPPLRAILLHNDFTELDARAKRQNAPTEQFAKYIFLLELSHVWGPAINIPIGDGGGAPDELCGFPFHWSFWMDAGGSPAGGNAWKDNGDGTFTASGQLPKDVRYSMLDLYLMGLADPSEVLPFGVLENAVPPSGVKDPFTGGSYSAQSFPWFGATPFTVTATRRTLTIGDVVATNGPRTPAHSASSMKLGIVLMLSAATTDDEAAALESQFDAVADSLAPAFHDATRGRGTLDVVTHSEPPIAADADGGAGDDAGVPGEGAAPNGTKQSSGCGVSSDGSGSGGGGGAALGALVVALLALATRGRRALRE